MRYTKRPSCRQVISLPIDYLRNVYTQGQIRQYSPCRFCLYPIRTDRHLRHDSRSHFREGYTGQSSLLDPDFHSMQTRKLTWAKNRTFIRQLGKDLLPKYNPPICSVAIKLIVCTRPISIPGKIVSRQRVVPVVVSVIVNLILRYSRRPQNHAAGNIIRCTVLRIVEQSLCVKNKNELRRKIERLLNRKETVFLTADIRLIVYPIASGCLAIPAELRALQIKYQICATRI